MESTDFSLFAVYIFVQKQSGHEGDGNYSDNDEFVAY